MLPNFTEADSSRSDGKGSDNSRNGKGFSAKTEIKAKRFGDKRKYSYLCSVKMNILTTPLSAGSKALLILLHLKSHHQVTFLLFKFLSELAIKHGAINLVPADGENFPPLENQDFHCIGVGLEIRLNIRSQKTSIVVRIHVKENPVTLTDRLQEPGTCRSLALYGLEVVHLITTPIDENEIGGTHIFWVGQDKYFVSMLYRFSCRKELTVVVFAAFTACSKYPVLAFYGFEDAKSHQHLQLSHEVGSPQHVEPSQFCRYIYVVFVHLNLL